MNLKFTNTTCPMCNTKTLEPLWYSYRNPAMAHQPVLTRNDIAQGCINLAPGIPVYLKRCTVCGFIACYDAKLVEKRGIL